MSLGERIKFLLNQKGINQKDLASNIGISQTHAGYIIKGLREPTAGIVYKIAIFFDVSIDWLMGRDENVGGMVREPETRCLTGPVQDLVEIFISLDKKEQKTVLDMVRALKKQG